ncbi:MAG TPA: ASCH domain-containing protein [Candidatus Eisenbacteria bacterium]|nr:ASCH domain-containing protein [Candidatus Eisenbacteria bacterium]
MQRRRLELGRPRTALRRRLVEAVLRGDKTATASLRDEYEPHTGEPLPAVGESCMLVGWDDEPMAVLETTEVRVVPAGQVDLRFARDEGEGFRSVADWRAAHERFWSGRGVTDETPVVCERFRLMARFG